MRIRGKIMLLILVLTAVMVVPQKAQAAMPADTLYVYYFATGSSDCILIELNGKFMLVDTSYTPENTSPKDAIKKATAFMKRKGVKELEYLIITHYDGDHIGGLDYVTDNFKVNKFISRIYSKGTLGRMRSHLEDNKFPYQNYIKMVNNIAKNAGSNKRISKEVDEEQLSAEIQNLKNELYPQGKWNWVFPKKNEKLNFSNATMTFLHKETTYITSTSLPEDYNGHVNNDSIVFSLEYKGKSFLFTGDLGPTGRRNLIGEYGDKLKFDVIKSPHHGYKGSNQWGGIQQAGKARSNYSGNNGTETGD